MIPSKLPRTINDERDLEFLGTWDHDVPPLGWSLCYNTTDYEPYTNIQIAYNPNGDYMWERALYGGGDLFDKPDYPIDKIADVNPLNAGEMLKCGFMRYPWPEYDTEDWIYMPINLKARCVFE